MTGRGRTAPRGSGVVGTIALVGAVTGFALVTEIPFLLALAIGFAGVGGSIALRYRGTEASADLAAAPTLVSVATLVLGAPPTPEVALVAGVVALAILVWYADDPSRSPGGLRRARSTLSIVALTLGIAWGCAVLLAGSSRDIGIAGGLLTVSLFLVVPFLDRPQRLETPAPAID